MIKRIICPTDFSEAANNAIEYSAKLAQVLNAKLLLLNLHEMELSAPVAYADEISNDPTKNTALALDTLEKTSTEVNKTYTIVCDFKEEVTLKSLTGILTSMEDESTMIVMGTGGIATIAEFFFGTNTYKVIKKAKCPVLLIPTGCSYNPYQRVVYAMAYEEKGSLALKPFNDFISHFNAGVTFLHISEHETDISRDVFRAEREEIESFFGEKKSEHLAFERLYSRNVENAIKEFVEKSSTDLLVMAARHRNIFEALLKSRPLLSDLSATPTFPILVFHS
jgi:nucleotide-binding universal stress UspA family protein